MNYLNDYISDKCISLINNRDISKSKHKHFRDDFEYIKGMLPYYSNESNIYYIERPKDYIVLQSIDYNEDDGFEDRWWRYYKEGEHFRWHLGRLSKTKRLNYEKFNYD